MLKQRLSREEFLQMFREDVIRLSRYTPWLEVKSGSDVSVNYTDGNKMDHTLSFPVYDSILLSFLNEASTTVFMERNYHYFYTRNQIRDYKDELYLIEKADIMNMDILQCILSRYIFGGMTKAYLWRDGVENRVFLAIMKKARQIVEFWDQPLIIEDEILPEEEEEAEVAPVVEVEPVEVEQADIDGFVQPEVEEAVDVPVDVATEDAEAAPVAEEAPVEETVTDEVVVDVAEPEAPVDVAADDVTTEDVVTEAPAEETVIDEAVADVAEPEAPVDVVPVAEETPAAPVEEEAPAPKKKRGRPRKKKVEEPVAEAPAEEVAAPAQEPAEEAPVQEPAPVNETTEEV